MYAGVDEPPILDVRFDVTPDGAERQSRQAQTRDGASFELLGRSGGVRATRVIANEEVQLLRDEIADPGGYVVVLLLHGSCMAGHEYLDRPLFVVCRPGAPLPQLHGGAEALIVSMGPEGLLNTESRLKLTLPSAMRMCFALSPTTRSLLGRTMRVADIRPADDVHVYTDVQGGNPPRPDGHKHPGGGELLLILDGQVRDRSLELRAFDLLVSGPLTGHGPEWGKQGGMVMTITLGQDGD